MSNDAPVHTGIGLGLEVTVLHLLTTVSAAGAPGAE